MRRRATPANLLGAIVQSRSAALLYHGLLSLDDETREWLEGRPALLTELASRHSAAFLAAAPGLRVSTAGMRLPGGPESSASWQSLAGRRPDEPADFVRALVSTDEGALALFFGAIAQLTPAQAAAALNLGAPDVKTRVESARRMHPSTVASSVRGSISAPSRASPRPGTSPQSCPQALTDAPLSPAVRRFWTAVFGDGEGCAGFAGRTPTPGRRATRPSTPWLCEQVFKGEPLDQRHRYVMVMFASRLPPR